MPEVRSIRVRGVRLEDPACGSAIHRDEPGTVVELGPSTGHGLDISAVFASLMDELDRAQHVHLADGVGGKRIHRLRLGCTGCNDAEQPSLLDRPPPLVELAAQIQERVLCEARGVD